MTDRDRIATALLTLRLGVFLVMLVWTIDKFLNVDHAAGVFQAFYGLGGLGRVALFAMGAIELLVIVAFVVGYRKRLSYGLVFLFHAISTLSSYRQYLDPFDSLLFFAAWPMLAACFSLYLLRDLDTRWTIARAHGSQLRQPPPQ